MRRRAFTLIELLIVVAIIAILAAIAVPNFLEAQTRARVARTDNDLRTIDLAMESYHIDNRGYGISLADNKWLPPFTTYAGNDNRYLSTPISYLTEMPPDIFRKIAGLANPAYWIYAGSYTEASVFNHRLYPKMAWMTWSNGPDQVTCAGSYRGLKDIMKNESLPIPQLGTQVSPDSGGGPAFDGMRYDPTNGTVSVGDIYRFGGGAKTTLNRGLYPNG